MLTGFGDRILALKGYWCCQHW